MSQWANFRSSNTTNGWSAYSGQTFGAYYPKQDPSGSSSGSAVSSSIGLALAALGTETDGSIVSPSEMNNCVGIKPTVGLTSRYLVIPISEHQDTVGPIARSVKDAAYILQAIAGVDPRDNYTSAIPNGGKLPDYVAACKAGSLKGAVFGVPRNALDLFFPSSPANDPDLAAFEASLTVLHNAGAKVTDTKFTALQEFASSNNEIIVTNADFLVNLATYLSELTFNPTKVHNLQQVRKFTKIFRQETFPDRDVAAWNGALNPKNIPYVPTFLAIELMV